MQGSRRASARSARDLAAVQKPLADHLWVFTPTKPIPADQYVVIYTKDHIPLRFCARSFLSAGELHEQLFQADPKLLEVNSKWHVSGGLRMIRSFLAKPDLAC